MILLNWTMFATFNSKLIRMNLFAITVHIIVIFYLKIIANNLIDNMFFASAEQFVKWRLELFGHNTVDVWPHQWVHWTWRCPQTFVHQEMQATWVLATYLKCLFTAFEENNFSINSLLVTLTCLSDARCWPKSVGLVKAGWQVGSDVDDHPRSVTHVSGANTLFLSQGL